MITLIPLLPQHWEAVKTIYEEGIATGNATFQTTAQSWQEWNDSHVKNCRIVAIENSEILGWAALTPVSSRCVYAGVAEVSVYVAAKARGKRIGTIMLQELINQSEQNGIWTLQSGIFPENKASISMHKKKGFRIIGYREKIGKMGTIWRDNISMERRSSIIGID
ncbi:GNAT family N-acetyltransferase [Parasediminibacterium sp. JCM 36343]|uniref:GNAT family N-acetyltransferase n=1 Tax=Parasediminibacterium sp. JCM 36343 TaxID=3374279 RepID=UPI00397B8209